MAFIGRFAYPGLDASIVSAAQYSFGHGITPGVITVEVPAGTGVPEKEGTAIFAFGGTVLQIRGCRVDVGQSRIGGGQTWVFTILDFRWKWQFGEISGHYNLPKPDGSLRTETEKSPRELAQLCLQAMGVANYDLSQLPDAARPQVDWSFENPAQALATLADAVGCRVVPRLDGSVILCRTGEGQSLPNFPALSIDFTYSAGAIPSNVKVVGGVALFQGRWELEAVGLDTDGKIKPVEELSYKPAAGWQNESPGILSGVASLPDDSLKDPKKLALDTVFRWYRLKDGGFIGGKFSDEGATWENRKDVLPVSDGLVQTFKSAEGDATKRRPAVIRGKFQNGDQNFTNKENGTYKGKFTIDRELGIVQFDEPCYQNVDGGGFDFAEINVELAFPAMQENREPFRQDWKFPVNPQQGVGDFIMRRDEIVFTAVLGYNPDGTADVWTDNREDDALDEQAGYAASVYASSLQPQQAGSRTFPGLYDVRLDGAIQQVSWAVGRGAICTTSVSRNSEHDTDVYPPYRARRRKEKTDAAVEKVNDGRVTPPGANNGFFTIWKS